MSLKHNFIKEWKQEVHDNFNNRSKFYVSERCERIIVANYKWK